MNDKTEIRFETTTPWASYSPPTSFVYKHHGGVRKSACVVTQLSTSSLISLSFINGGQRLVISGELELLPEVGVKSGDYGYGNRFYRVSSPARVSFCFIHLMHYYYYGEEKQRDRACKLPRIRYPLGIPGCFSTVEDWAVLVLVNSPLTFFLVPYSRFGRNLSVSKI